MGSHVYWLFFFVLLYWGYCITIGITGYLRAKKGTDYFCRPPGFNLARRPALRICIFLCADDSVYGRAFSQAPVADRQTLWVCHPGGDVQRIF